MNVPVKKLHPDAKLPLYGSEHAAGADIFAFIDKEITIQPGETVLVPTGICTAIPQGYVGLIFARSGLSLKKGLTPANKVGVIDADYRGEIKVMLYNQSGAPQTVSPQERIAQMAIVPYLKAAFEETDSLDATDRGGGGFGSTGKF